MPTINWGSIATGTITFIALLALKTLLDLRVALVFVKWFSWLPVRNVFRNKPLSLAGQWDQTWESADSESFTKGSDRHSNPIIKQLDCYCYAEFFSKKVKYILFGKVIGSYLVGDWYDANDPHGYFGAFQLEIVDSKTMKGRWVGHSKTSHEIKGDVWEWNKCE